MSEEWREEEGREDAPAAQERQDEQSFRRSWKAEWRRDGLSAVVWAVILIWIGLVLLLENLNILPRQVGLTGWSLILLGAGVILLLEAAMRLIVPAYRRPLAGTLILAVVLLAVGAISGGGWGRMWPIVLIIIGLIVLLRSLISRR
mgnify:CR=1 FL=1